jgi:hypothetical protein
MGFVASAGLGPRAIALIATVAQKLKTPGVLPIFHLHISLWFLILIMESS